MIVFHAEPEQDRIPYDPDEEFPWDADLQWPDYLDPDGADDARTS